MNCLIVEDEPLAAEILREYIEQIPGLSLKGVCGDVFAAMQVLRAEKIDVIFLDINLPRVSGLEFIQTLQGKYHIILTTAYHEFALEGFNLNAVDYLLKPIEYSRFLQAVNKVYALQKNPAAPPAAETAGGRTWHFFWVDKKHVRVYADEIIYVESLKDYIRIHTVGGQLVTKFQLSEMDQLLAGGRFCRIHKSFIVNLDRVTAYNAQEVELGSIRLPIGRTWADIFRSRVEA